jgi:hypothetical protein
MVTISIQPEHVLTNILCLSATHIHTEYRILLSYRGLNSSQMLGTRIKRYRIRCLTLNVHTFNAKWLWLRQHSQVSRAGRFLVLTADASVDFEENMLVYAVIFD